MIRPLNNRELRTLMLRGTDAVNTLLAMSLELGDDDDYELKRIAEEIRDFAFEVDGRIQRVNSMIER